MKLIVDIPEEECKRWATDGLMDAIIVRDALADATPLSEVFGDIKADIKSEYDALRNRRDEAIDLGESLGLTMALLIINKHIGKENDNANSN